MDALTTLSLPLFSRCASLMADDAHTAFQADIVFHKVFNGQLSRELPKLTVGTAAGSPGSALSSRAPPPAYEPPSSDFSDVVFLLGDDDDDAEDYADPRT